MRSGAPPKGGVGLSSYASATTANDYDRHHYQSAAEHRRFPVVQLPSVSASRFDQDLTALARPPPTTFMKRDGRPGRFCSFPRGQLFPTGRAKTIRGGMAAKS